MLFTGRYKADNRKLLMGGVSLIAAICLISIVQFENIGNVLKATFLMFDDKAQDAMGVSGSTVELRIMQYLTVFSMIKQYMLQGMGYGFPAYFYEVIWDVKKYGLRDDVAGFESILLPILSSFGLIGLCLWIKMFYGVVKLQIRQCVIKMQRHYISAFSFAYLFVVTLTDTTGSMYLFFLLSAMNIYYMNLSRENLFTKLIMVKMLREFSKKNKSEK